jgi:hypothetical protein
MPDEVEEGFRLSELFGDSGILGVVLDTGFLCSGRHIEVGFVFV